MRGGPLPGAGLQASRGVVQDDGVLGEGIGEFALVTVAQTSDGGDGEAVLERVQWVGVGIDGFAKFCGQAPEGGVVHSW